MKLTIYVEAENTTGLAPDTVVSVRARRETDDASILIADGEQRLADDGITAAVATLLKNAVKLVDGTAGGDA